MSYFKIEKALMDFTRSIVGSTPVEYPDMTLDEDKKNGLWLKVSNIQGFSAPVTLGDEGEDNHPGILQIDVNYPQNSGSAYVLNKVDAIVPQAPAGTAFTYNGQTVKLMGTSVGGGRYVGGYYRISISIQYYARTKRR